MGAEVKANHVTDLIRESAILIIDIHKDQIQRLIIIDIAESQASAAGFIGYIEGQIQNAAPVFRIPFTVNVPADTIAKIIITTGIINSHKDKIRFAVAVNIGDGQAATLG